MSELPLGVVVRDQVTGLIGAIFARHYMLDGAISYTVQPYTEDGKEMKEGRAIDACTLVMLLDESNARELTVIEPDPKALEIALGSEVCDKILPGNSGIVIERSIYLNGCVYYTVILQKSVNKTDELQPRLHLSANRLRVIGEGLLAKDKPVKDTIENTGKGGPNRIPMSRR